ncbi:MAG: hypothetical protein AVDCRST_MAG95-3755 [uncultured Adhaeribacter sp.]|uniref:Uncharacterized protein n=1 Tax=uncultured Adhaeribacter sp. TaxID=448109 RepID=A0A6J4JTQ9_9BACT|nr:MAG: hypothetical protein AVDCRST_MAG95-3755 [uncultured Adhaeribacter sp.]
MRLFGLCPKRFYFDFNKEQFNRTNYSTLGSLIKETVYPHFSFRQI